MKQNSKRISLEFNLPEFSRKDIKVKLTQNSLRIKAQRSQIRKIQKKDFFHKEKGSKTFNYVTSLPTINPKKAKINFEKGKLKITALKV